MPLSKNITSPTMQEQKYRYTLGSNKVQKLDCPYCGAKKHWQQYIDTQTGELLPAPHGRCDNQDKCGQWIKPSDTGYSKDVWEQEQGLQGKSHYRPKMKPVAKPKPKPPVFIPYEVLKATRKAYGLNTFIQNLLENVPYPFSENDIARVVSQYHLGTIPKGYMTGAVTFPFIDSNGKVRAIQAKKFDKDNHTVKTSFIHAILESFYKEQGKPSPQWLKAYQKQDKKVSCLFGAHLLDKYPHNPIALVEAPKTAIYGTLYFGFPENPKNFLWLAVYNLGSLTLDKCLALKGRQVYLFPDSSKSGNAYKQWSNKAQAFNMRVPRTRFEISDLLEQYAPQDDREQGTDLADYLIKLDWKHFRDKPNNRNRAGIEQGQNSERTAKEKPLVGEKGEKSEAQKKHFFCHEAYTSQLHWENGLLMAGGYPADWDLTAPYLSEETKGYLEQVLAGGA